MKWRNTKERDLPTTINSINNDEDLSNSFCNRHGDEDVLTIVDSPISAYDDIHYANCRHENILTIE